MAEGGARHYTEMDSKADQKIKYEYEHESREISTIMNLLGYGPVIRQIRRDVWKEYDRLMVDRRYNYWMYQITAGSKAEGLSCMYESDIDLIFAMKNAMCVEENIDQSTFPGRIILFSMNNQRTSAGYCRLLLGRHDLVIPTFVRNSLCDDGRGHSILSSTLFFKQFKDIQRNRMIGTVSHARAGPSMPFSCGPCRFDRTTAIRCHCPSIPQTWANRPRHWPPPEVVEKVVAMGAFVTPIGYKRSEYNHVEWRICFNTAETDLVNNLNDTQVKIYVILKMIVKDILKPQMKEITSYVLKNIVLWLAEDNPQTLFHSGSVLHWLHEGLGILRTVISTRQLPYYMIPERNLMADRDLEDEQQHMWVTSITCMMDEGPMIVRRLEKIRHAIISHPEPLLWYSKMRTEIESLNLMNMNSLVRIVKVIDGNIRVDWSDTMHQTLNARLNEVLRGVLWRMVQEGSSVEIDLNKVTRMILS